MMQNKKKKRAQFKIAQSTPTTQASGLTLNTDNCEFCTKEMMFVDDLLAQGGMKLSPMNTKAVVTDPAF